MDNRFLLPLAVIVLVIIGGLVLLGSNNFKPGAPLTPGVGGGPGVSSSASPSSNQNTVTYSSTGFDPKTITIKMGQTVTWVNQDTNSLQVASSPHPTHTDYPPLNSVGTIEPGQMSSFTFSTAGTFKYHDHLNPQNWGEVIVEP